MDGADSLSGVRTKSTLPREGWRAARTLLDDAAGAVRETRGRAGAVQSAHREWGRKLEIVGGNAHMEAFSNAGQRVYLLTPRIEVMFGADSPVTTAYAECLGATDRVSRAANGLYGAPDGADVSELVDDIEEGTEAISAALDRFVAAAHRAVAVR